MGGHIDRIRAQEARIKALEDEIEKLRKALDKSQKNRKDKSGRELQELGQDKEAA